VGQDFIPRAISNRATLRLQQRSRLETGRRLKNLPHSQLLSLTVRGDGEPKLRHAIL
jgi:hypothetical protein